MKLNRKLHGHHSLAGGVNDAAVAAVAVNCVADLEHSAAQGPHAGVLEGHDRA